MGSLKPVYPHFSFEQDYRAKLRFPFQSPQSLQENYLLIFSRGRGGWRMGWEWMVYYPPQHLVSSSWQASFQQLGVKNGGDNKSLHSFPSPLLTTPPEPACSQDRYLLFVIVIFLDFHSTKWELPLVDSWSHGLD